MGGGIKNPAGGPESSTLSMILAMCHRQNRLVGRSNLMTKSSDLMTKSSNLKNLAGRPDS